MPRVSEAIRLQPFDEENSRLKKRKCRTKRQLATLRKPTEIISGPDECWATDFVHGNLANVRAIRILSIINLWDRTCPKLEDAFSQTGQSVIATLSALKDQGGLPERYARIMDWSSDATR